ncbi:MAG: hypothetical protein Q9191_007219 [Dirinaria sp. TL-2023a]
MPDIDPAALSRTDSISQPSTSLTISKPSTAPTSSAPKAQKASNAVQRIDLEPLYTSLKAAIGDQWAKYKEATSLFILGRLNQNELSVQIGHFFNADPSIEHVHNQLISAIHGNVSRDVPDQGVAPWVSANDKPTVLSKPVVGDAAEQRLKTEVMQMPARDRRRLKEVHDVSPMLYAKLAVQYANKNSVQFTKAGLANNKTNQKQGENMDPLAYSVAVSINDYLSSKTIKLPDTVPASAGGLNKTTKPSSSQT